MKKILTICFILITILLLGSSYQSQINYHQGRITYYRNKMVDDQKQIFYHQGKIEEYMKKDAEEREKALIKSIEKIEKKEKQKSKN
jgi:hypothetical protein